MFRFKQFRVNDDRCAMKIGTDGVLLGAWADVKGAKKVLDVGTGSGLISLMIAQRNEDARIIGIDIDGGALVQAKENVGASPWVDRIDVMECDFNHPDELSQMEFELIVSNPPFYTADTHSDDSQRDLARNAASLPLANLMKNIGNLMSQKGLLSIVLPSEAAEIAIGEAAINSLFLTRRCVVYSRPDTHPKRILLEFARHIQPTEHDEITICQNDGAYSNEFIKLTRDFYL